MKFLVFILLLLASVVTMANTHKIGYLGWGLYLIVAMMSLGIIGLG